MKSENYMQNNKLIEKISKDKKMVHIFFLIFFKYKLWKTNYRKLFRKIKLQYILCTILIYLSNIYFMFV